MLWSLVQMAGRQGVGLFVFLVLATLLEPADFGLLGMALVVTSFIQVFSEVGFGSALIQRHKLRQSHISSVFVLNILLGVVLTVAGAAMSLPGAWFFNIPELEPIIAVLSLGFFINAFSNTHTAIALRKMRFRALAVRDVVASVTSGIAGIAMAYAGYGVWSLVVQSLVGGLVSTVLVWLMVDVRVSLRDASLDALRELWPYTSSIFAFNVIKYFAQNADKLLVGYLLGSIALGLYTFAFRVVVLPVSLFVGAIGNYLFPKYSKLQNNVKVIGESYGFILKIINTVVFPVLILFVVGSPFFVSHVWGERWMDAVPIMQTLALLAFVQSIISPVGQVMKALGRPQWLVRWSVYITLVVMVFIWYGARLYGLEGATWGITLAYLTGVPVNLVILKRLIGLRPLGVANALYPSVVAGCITVVPALWIILERPFTPLENLFLLVAGSIIIYILNMTLLDREFVTEVIKRLRQRLEATR